MSSSFSLSTLALYSRPGPILLASLGLGFAGDYLLWLGLAGPGLAIWLALLRGVVFALPLLGVFVLLQLGYLFGGSQLRALNC